MPAAWLLSGDGSSVPEDARIGPGDASPALEESLAVCS